LNIVFTRSCNNSRESGALTGRKWQHADFPGCYTVGSFEEIRILPLNAWEGKPIFVIGGAELYALALAIADVGSMLYLTRVELEPEGDVFFPAFDLEQWQLIASEARCDEDTNQIGIRFETYERRTK
jgi:dihydrofolate reductase